MQPKVSQLKNGLQVATIEMPQVYSVSICVFIGVGSRYEEFDTNGGISHFLEHLLFKGSKKWPSTKIISETLDSVGGSSNAYTSNDLTNFYVKLPSKHAALALDILSDMIRHPILDPEEVDRERGVVVEEMNVYRDDPARYIHDMIPGLLWPDDPLGREIIGPEAVIKTIPRDAIAAYQRQHYSPDNMVVVLAGKVKHDWAVKEVEKLMGDMPAAHQPPLPPLKAALSRDLVKSMTKETNQAHLVIGAHGYPYYHRDDMAARVMSNVLGSGLSSRLFLEVRERQGLAYTVYADYSNFVDTGMFEVYAGVNLDKVEQALESIMAELQKIRQEPVTAAELDKVKHKMSGSLQMSLESTSAVADRFGSRLLLTGQAKSIEATLAEIEAVSIEHVQRVARAMLAPDKLRLAVISPDPGPAERQFARLVKGSK